MALIYSLPASNYLNNQAIMKESKSKDTSSASEYHLQEKIQFCFKIMSII